MKHFKCNTVICGAEHVISIIFANIAKITPLCQVCKFSKIVSGVADCILSICLASYLNSNSHESISEGIFGSTHHGLVQFLRCFQGSLQWQRCGLCFWVVHGSWVSSITLCVLIEESNPTGNKGQDLHRIHMIWGCVKDCQQWRNVGCFVCIDTSTLPSIPN